MDDMAAIRIHPVCFVIKNVLACGMKHTAYKDVFHLSNHEHKRIPHFESQNGGFFIMYDVYFIPRFSSIYRYQTAIR